MQSDESTAHFPGHHSPSLPAHSCTQPLSALYQDMEQEMQWWYTYTHVPVYLADPPVVDHTLTPPYAIATLGPTYLIVLTFLGKGQPLLHACVYCTFVKGCVYMWMSVYIWCRFCTKLRQSLLFAYPPYLIIHLLCTHVIVVKIQLQVRQPVLHFATKPVTFFWNLLYR